MAEKVSNFIIDFDSTFIQVEAFDELCKLCYKDEKEREIILEQVKAITNQGMSGELTITESLEKRLLLLKAHKDHLEPLIALLSSKISTSFERNKEFLKRNSENIFIVSNGFSEFILPIVVKYGIKAHKVFANSFEYDENENIIGFDKTNVLAEAKGKVKLVSELELEGDIIVIGDGFTDYEIMEAGVATRFYAFTENVSRENVISKAQNIAPSFDHIIADFEGDVREEIETINTLKK